MLRVVVVRVLSGALILTGALASCGGEATAPTPSDPLVPADLEAVSGDAQAGEVGAALGAPLIVGVVDTNGSPVPGVLVTWEITAGGGAITPASGRTGTQGRATATWTLGTVTGASQAVTVSVQGLTPLSFSAVTEPGPVHAVSVLPASVTLPVGETVQLTATLEDRFGNSISDQGLTWTTSMPEVATVSELGLVVATAPGPVEVRASAGGQSGAGQLDVLAVVAPVIAGVSPSPIVAGEMATILGSDFSPVVEGNVVTIAGVDAAVISVMDSELTVMVPVGTAFECAPTQSVPVSVSVPDQSSIHDHPLSVAALRSLAVGESLVLLEEDEVGCNEIDATGGSYLLSVTNTSTVASAASAFRLRGADGSGAVGTVAPMGAPTMDESSGPSADERRAAAIHNRLLEQARELFEVYQPVSPGSTDVQPMPAPARAPQLGEQFAIRVPDVDDACGAYTEITAEVAYAGSRGIVLEDVDAPLAYQMDSYFEALGAEFDDRMFDILVENFGNPLAMDAQLDNNERILMVFTPLVNSMGGPSLQGFVAPADFFPRSTCAASDVGELFYARVPTSVGELTGWYEGMLGTVIHEVKHITSNAERLSGDASVLEESWLEEGTAQVASELWARQIYGYDQFDNTTYASSVACELQCANSPDVMSGHFDFLYQYYGDVNNLTPLGKASPDDATFYGSAWHLVRWAADHFGGNEASFFRTLTQETELSGVGNLEARTGVPFTEMLGLWSLQAFIDDLGVGTRAELTTPSWNTRDIFAGLNADYPASFPNATPLVGYTVSYGAFTLDVPAVHGGSAAYVLLQGTQSARQLIQLQSASGGEPPSPLRVSIVRFQ